MLAETREREPSFAFQDERHTCPGRVARVCKERSRVHLNLSLDGPEDLHDRRMRSGRGTHALAVQAVRRVRDADMPSGCIAVITDRTLDHGRRLSVSEEFRRLGQEIDAGRNACRGRGHSSGPRADELPPRDRSPSSAR